MSPVQLTALLPETDIYGDPIKEVETTERAHSPEPLPTPPPINNRPSGFLMLQHQPCQHHAHPIAPCSHVIEPVRVFLPRSRLSNSPRRHLSRLIPKRSLDGWKTQCSYKSLTTKQREKIATPISTFIQTYALLPNA